MEQRLCQSCGMPLSKEFFAANADGSENTEYCKFCYENGKFTSDVTMEQMIEECVPHMVSGGMAEGEARAMLRQMLPKLKRWQA